jgi:glycosyltransferase involved in cell wall biosynthesis
METLPPIQAWGAKQVDAIWVPSEFSAVAFREHCTSVHVVHHAVEVSDFERLSREDFGLPEDAYVVHFAFDVHSTMARKNPNGVVAAFRKAFDTDESAYLLLKVRNYGSLRSLADLGDRDARELLQTVHSHPRIVVVGREMTRSKTLGLLVLSDCHLSLHRAEGFGYGMAEAMALGVPVVATGYSGNMTYMNTGNSWPIEYRTRAVMPNEYLFTDPGFRWAEPDLDDAAAQLMNCRFGSDRLGRIEEARSIITANFSLEEMSARMKCLLDQYVDQ